MQCEIHKKEMRQGNKGYYCPTPVEKSPDGKTVLKWCQWKPATTETEPLQNKTLDMIHALVLDTNTKVTKIVNYLDKTSQKPQNRPQNDDYEGYGPNTTGLAPDEELGHVDAPF